MILTVLRRNDPPVQLPDRFAAIGDTVLIDRRVATIDEAVDLVIEWSSRAREADEAGCEALQRICANDAWKLSIAVERARRARAVA